MYPDGQSARDRFVVSRRPKRATHDPWRAHGTTVEDEPEADGTPARIATVFLIGRECPWRCAMCDLWKFTTTDDTPAGAIAAQVSTAAAELAATQPDVAGIKLYNAGSFFDPRAVPDGDYDGVAEAVGRFTRLIVESHPSMVGRRTERFLAALDRQGETPTLEVAMGLETAHPSALERLNKRMSVADFDRAASRLAAMGAAVRVFLLVGPPFVPDDQQDDWLERSIDAAVAAGATAISLIPTRGGNGTIDALQAEGQFRSPHLQDVERSLTLALNRVRTGTRVFADLWDIERFGTCPSCLLDRRERLRQMNLKQQTLPPVACAVCDGGE